MRIKRGSLLRSRISTIVLLILWGILLYWITPDLSLRESILDFMPTREESTYDYFVYSGHEFRQAIELEEIPQQYNNDKLVQKGYLPNTRLNAVEILMNNWNSTDAGKFNVQIIDETGKLRYERVVDKGELGDQDGDGYLESVLIRFPGEIEILNRPVTLLVSAESLTRENAVIVKCTYYDNAVNAVWDVQSKQLNLQGAVKVLHVYTNWFFLISVLVLFATAVFYIAFSETNFQRSVLVVLLGSGMSMLLMLSPFSQPDEIYHYNSSYVLSNVVLQRENINDFENGYHDFYDIKQQENTETGFVRAMHELTGRKTNSFERQPYFGNKVNSLSHPIAYLFSSIGLIIGRIGGLNFMQSYYLGRIFNLVVYSFLIYMAVEVCPFCKELLLLVSVLPMMLQQATGYSYDVLQNGMSILFISYILYLIFEKKVIQLADWIFLGLVLFVFGPIKMVYSLLICLAFAVPNLTKRIFRSKYLCIGLSLFLIAVFGVLTRTQYYQMAIDGFMSDYGNQYAYSFVLKHPRRFAKMFFITAYEFSYKMLAQAIGDQLSGLDIYLPPIIVFLFVLLILLLGIHSKTDPEISKRYIVLAGFIFILGSIAVTMSMLVATSVGRDHVENIQGRYYTLFLIPLFFALGRVKLESQYDKRKLFNIYWFLELAVIFSIANQIR